MLFCRISCLSVHLTLVLHLYVCISLCTDFGFCVPDGIVCDVVYLKGNTGFHVSCDLT